MGLPRQRHVAVIVGAGDGGERSARPVVLRSPPTRRCPSAAVSVRVTVLPAGVFVPVGVGADRHGRNGRVVDRVPVRCRDLGDVVVAERQVADARRTVVACRQRSTGPRPRRLPRQAGRPRPGSPRSLIDLLTTLIEPSSFVVVEGAVENVGCQRRCVNVTCWPLIEGVDATRCGAVDVHERIRSRHCILVKRSSRCRRALVPLIVPNATIGERRTCPSRKDRSSTSYGIRTPWCRHPERVCLRMMTDAQLWMFTATGLMKSLSAELN